jgi:KDO2-lipid IV(A) lauroyltransferase
MALFNVKGCFPEHSQADQRQILKGMWDNLGRVLAEYSHLPELALSLDFERVEIVGAEHVPQNRTQPVLFFTAHYANWEIAALSILHLGLPVKLVYRAASNPLVDRLMRGIRCQGIPELVPLGVAGARSLLQEMHQNSAILTLLDQRANNGLPVPFFGRPALTSPGIGHLALRKHYPLVPVQVLRHPGTARFKVRFYPPLPLPQEGSQEERLLALMANVNQQIETWVRERPDLWFWLHSRWGKLAS